jgi:S-adenosylmethionine hydrolase
MSNSRPVFLFTDFGYAGPYVGQMTAAILAVAPKARVINLMHDAPSMRADLSAYLLAACCRALPVGAVVVAVVDPGVGGERDALLVEAQGLTLVGPDNGLLSKVPGIDSVQRIDWRPAVLSPSFHGRDLFAPVAAMTVLAEQVPGTAMHSAHMIGSDWPGELPKLLYVDGFGNLMSGISGENVSKNSVVHVSGRALGYAETFCRVPQGQLFWYVNALGLVEIAANGGSAAANLPLALGDRILLD